MSKVIFIDVDGTLLTYENMTIKNLRKNNFVQKILSLDSASRLFLL